MSQTQDYLFNSIIEELYSGGITGWCEPRKALDLAATVLALRPDKVCELGVWNGRSLLPMAMACQFLGHGVVIGIDPWSPDASTEGYDAVNADWWAKQPHQRIYESFLGHVSRLGLQDYVAIERAKSADAAIPGTLDILHVDAQHSELAIADVRKFAPAVRMGGIVCMDDLEWVNNGIPHVKQAVEELLAMGFVELYRTKTDKGCWGFFQRVSQAPVPEKRKAKK